MSPNQARAWIRVIRDALLILAGTSIFATVLLLYVLRDEPPNVTLISVGCLCFGLGAALRADEWLVPRERNGNGNGGGTRGR